MPASWPVVRITPSAAYVAKRDEGQLGGAGPVRRARIIDPWLAKIEEWVERSHAKIRADRCYAKLKALGFEGSGPHGAPSSGGGQEELRGGSGGGCIGRGSPSRACGRSGTGARARSFLGEGRICFVRGWRGRGSGW